MVPAGLSALAADPFRAWLTVPMTGPLERSGRQIEAETKPPVAESEPEVAGFVLKQALSTARTAASASRASTLEGL